MKGLCLLSGIFLTYCSIAGAEEYMGTDTMMYVNALAFFFVSTWCVWVIVDKIRAKRKKIDYLSESEISDAKAKAAKKYRLHIKKERVRSYREDPEGDLLALSALAVATSGSSPRHPDETRYYDSEPVSDASEYYSCNDSSSGGAGDSDSGGGD